MVQAPANSPQVEGSSQRMADATSEDADDAGSWSAVSTSKGIEVDISGALQPMLDIELVDLLDAVFREIDGSFYGAEMSISLVDDDAIQQLNRDYRGKDKPTNVLSFPGEQNDDTAVFPIDGMPRFLGDVILSAETLEREALAAAKPLSHHLAHLIVHGTLHLIGYDHICDQEAQIMEALETRILGNFAIPDPYSDEKD